MALPLAEGLSSRSEACYRIASMSPRTGFAVLRYAARADLEWCVGLLRAHVPYRSLQNVLLCRRRKYILCFRRSLVMGDSPNIMRYNVACFHLLHQDSIPQEAVLLHPVKQCCLTGVDTSCGGEDQAPHQYPVNDHRHNAERYNSGCMAYLIHCCKSGRSGVQA